MAEEEQEVWIEANPPMDTILIFFVLILLPLALLLIFPFGLVGSDGSPSTPTVSSRIVGLCIILGLIPVYKRKRTGRLRWNDEKVQAIEPMSVTTTFKWQDLAAIYERAAFQRWTTLSFGYGKSLRLRTPQDIPLSDYYRVLNVAKRKLKENARTP